jgi:hypothetical protein
MFVSGKAFLLNNTDLLLMVLLSLIELVVRTMDEERKKSMTSDWRMNHPLMNYVVVEIKRWKMANVPSFSCWEADHIF